MVKVRSSQLTELANMGNRRARLAQHVSNHLDAYLSACQLGITLASLGLGWIGEPAIAHLIVEPFMTYFGAPEYLIRPVSFGIAFGIITFLHIVLGELAPKSIAIFRPVGASLWLSGPLMLFHKITYPAIWLLNGTANRMIGWFGIKPASEEEEGHTEEEIRILMKQSEKSGYIDKEELELVENVFNFSERIAREIMVPRTKFICLYADEPFEVNLQIVQEKRHTRYPVVEKDKDHIIGMVHASDIYNLALSAEDQDIRAYIRELMVVPETMEISRILKAMQKSRAHMVAVMDEFGGTAGLITLEDIIEELVGEIQDEIREERSEVEVLDNERTSLDGRMLISEINELFHIEIESEGVDTIGGWIYGQLNDTPTVGQQVQCGELTFVITEMEELRIERIEVNALPVEAGQEETTESPALHFSQNGEKAAVG